MKTGVLLQRIDASLATAEKALACLLTVLLVLTLAAAVLARHLLRIPSQSLLEAAPLLMLWLALTGASLALHWGRHIRLELVMRLAPEWARIAARLWVGLFGAVTMALLGWSALHFVLDEIAIFGPKGWGAMIFPLFFAVSALRCLIQAAAARCDPEKAR